VRGIVTDQALSAAASILIEGNGTAAGVREKTVDCNICLFNLPEIEKEEQVCIK